MREQGRPKLQRFRRTLPQVANCLPRATSPSRRPVRPKLTQILQNRRPLPSLHLSHLLLRQPPRCRPHSPMQSSYKLDAGLASRSVLVVCLDILVITINLNILFHYLSACIFINGSTNSCRCSLQKIHPVLLIVHQCCIILFHRLYHLILSGTSSHMPITQFERPPSTEWQPSR